MRDKPKSYWMLELRSSVLYADKTRDDFYIVNGLLGWLSIHLLKSKKIKMGLRDYGGEFLHWEEIE